MEGSLLHPSITKFSILNNSKRRTRIIIKDHVCMYINVAVDHGFTKLLGERTTQQPKLQV